MPLAGVAPVRIHLRQVLGLRHELRPFLCQEVVPPRVRQPQPGVDVHGPLDLYGRVQRALGRPWPGARLHLAPCIVAQVEAPELVEVSVEDVVVHRGLVAAVVTAEHPKAVLEEDSTRAIASAGRARPLALVDLPPRLLLDVEGPRVRLPGRVVVAVVVEVAVRDDHLAVVHNAARRVAHRGEVRAARDGQALRRGDRPCGRQRIGRHGVQILVALAICRLCHLRAGTVAV
mmetsp:Transcript_71141/g.171783  ORF Transcript_71141/g.171783 Transcript_71141/m.171783 type:complete len:231 (+) Transcript_71141:501-1193(+)